MQLVLQRGTAPLASHTVTQALVSAVQRSPLGDYPFDHVFMEEVFPQETYRALLAAVPDRRYFRELHHRDAVRADGTSTRLRMYLYPELLRRLPPKERRAWMPIGRALCSKQVENAFKGKFQTALEQRFGKALQQISLYPVPVLLRDQPGYRIGIHCDVPTKGITVQFFLPGDSSQRHLGTIFHEGDSGEASERQLQMPFLPDSAYAFPVSQTSWHSASRTTERDGERTSMMLTYYVTEELPLWLNNRLRRIGLFFGVHPKG